MTLTVKNLVDYAATTAAAVAAGMTPPPPLPIVLMQDAWNKRDRAALTAIHLRMTDSIIVYVSSAETLKVA